LSHYSVTLRDIHSFPTRRSSDLGVGCILLLAVAFTVLKGQDPTSTTPDTDSKAEQVEQRTDSALPVQIMKPQRQDVSYTITLPRSEEHTSELQSRVDLVCRLLLE